MQETISAQKAEDGGPGFEPISVYPKGPPKVTWIRYNFMRFIFILGNFLTMFAIVLIQIPSLLIQFAPYPYLIFCGKAKQESLKKWFYIRYKYYIQLTERCWASWTIIVTRVFLPGIG